MFQRNRRVNGIASMVWVLRMRLSIGFRGNVAVAEEVRHMSQWWNGRRASRSCRFSDGNSRWRSFKLPTRSFLAANDDLRGIYTQAAHFVVRSSNKLKWLQLCIGCANNVRIYTHAVKSHRRSCGQLVQNDNTGLKKINTSTVTPGNATMAAAHVVLQLVSPAQTPQGGR